MTRRAGHRRPSATRSPRGCQPDIAATDFYAEWETLLVGYDQQRA